MILKFLGALILTGLVPVASVQAQDFAIISPEISAGLPATSTSDAAKAVMQSADAALTTKPGPLPVVHTEGTLPGRGIREASLQARRDLRKMLDLALAYRVTGQRKYLDGADSYFRAWASVYVVSLNPIDETNFDAMILAYDLTEAHLPAPTRAAVDRFLQRLASGYLDAMDGAPKAFYNNWQSHRIMIAALAAFQLGDARLIDRTSEDYRKHVAANVLADGTVSDFYERDAIHYVIYNVNPMMMAGLAAKMHGLDWFHWTNFNRTGVSSVTDWLLPYAEGSKTHDEFVRSKVPFDAQRRAAGQTEFSGRWQSKEALTTFALASLLDARYEKPFAALTQRTGAREPNWLALYRAALGVRPGAPVAPPGRNKAGEP